MGLTGRTEWKEVLIVSDEDGRSFCFDCGWGVEPPVAYLPSDADWPDCVPPWLHGRRDEVIAVMRGLNHVTRDGPYRPYPRPR